MMATSSMYIRHDPMDLVHPPFTFHSYVNDAMVDWHIQHNRAIKSYQGNRALPEPTCDSGLATVLRSFMNNCVVSFEDWVAEEVAAFAVLAFPRALLQEICENGQFSRFLAELHGEWKPSFTDWAHFLWLLCGRASELFADVLFLMPNIQKDEPAKMGEVLFSELIKKGVYPEEACRSIIPVLLEHPLLSTYARKHATKLDEVCRNLNPIEVGMVVRSLVMYRARDDRCECGYDIDEIDCVCREKYLRNGRTGPTGLYLESDLQKEYACVLMKLVCEQHAELVLDMDLRWTKEDRDIFIVSSCEHVFSQQVYVELYQNLNGGEKPTLKQKYPRKLSEEEVQANALRNRDEDFGYNMAQHGGCVQSNCKQMMKKGCANVCCKQHCQKIGTAECRIHRMYSPVEVNLSDRKRILVIPYFNQRQDVPMKREGEEI